MPPLRIVLLGLALAGALGCSKPPEPAFRDASEADAALRKLCKTEYQFDVVTNAVGKTLWLYLPLEKPIFEFALKDKPPEEKENKEQRGAPPAWMVLSFDSQFREKTFFIEYDIVEATKPSRPYHESVSPTFTETFTEAENHLLTAVTRTHFELKDPKAAPDFVVLVIADVLKGVAVKETFALEDLKKVSVDALPQEEFMKRFLQESFGLKGLVGDKRGLSLDYKEVAWSAFLSEQITNRVYFKFQQSDFPPGPDAGDEVLKIVAQTVGDYQFNDFGQVKLTDLRAKKEYLFQKEQLKTFAPQ